MKGGVIFDFNGTLFWDTVYQECSWDKYLEKHGIVLSLQQKKEYIHGRNGRDTFQILFNREFSNEEVERLTEEKEIIYREECLKNEMNLAPGAEELLRRIKEKKIPMAIATASGRNNIEFFIEHLGILKYFERENIIYDDGTVKGKPDPEIFERAITRLGIDKEKTIIFEDSVSGVEAAKRSGVSQIILVNSEGNNSTKNGIQVIKSFEDFNIENLDSCE